MSNILQTKVKPQQLYKLNPIVARGNLTENYVLGGTACEVDQFWKYRENFRQEFRFNEEIMKNAQKELDKLILEWKNRTLNLNSTKNPFVITVHNRRGKDYASYMSSYKGSLLDKQYFSKAFDYFMKK